MLQNFLTEMEQSNEQIISMPVPFTRSARSRAACYSAPSAPMLCHIFTIVKAMDEAL